MKKRGFTLIELIVVISIIALLIGVLVPSINQIKVKAKELGQKSQFKNIGIGLEVWRNAHDMDYPDSTSLGTTSVTYGAHRLAEALVGRDLLGFDNNSTWDASADNGDAALYDPADITNRDNPHVGLTNLDVAQMGQVINPTSSTTDAYLGSLDDKGGALADDSAYVFTDAFRTKRITTANGDSLKIGTPILYYKALPTSNGVTIADYYNYDDNAGMLTDGHILDGTAHPSDPTDSTVFEEAVRNPKYDASLIPYNNESYLLHSAGADGLFGNRDDIWNFSK